MKFKSFTVTGDLYDDFLIIKSKIGVNRFVESDLVRKIGQHTQMPESAKKNYTVEEMQKYLKKFPEK